ncbi:hypothetical protein Tco_0413406 [Tanacetum coccineum]
MPAYVPVQATIVLPSLDEASNRIGVPHIPNPRLPRLEAPYDCNNGVGGWVRRVEFIVNGVSSNTFGVLLRQVRWSAEAMEEAMEEFKRFEEEIERESSKELQDLFYKRESERRIGKSMGKSYASNKYVEAALNSAIVVLLSYVVTLLLCCFPI